MRKSKFRAYDTELKEMAKITNWSEEEVTLQDENGAQWNTVAHYIAVIMQYTGLKDMKRTEIYESDYVRGFHRNFEVGNLVEVTFLNGCFMFGTYNAHEFFNMHQSIEVIGNIYENPELLKEE